MGFRRALIFGLLAGLSFVAHTAVAAGPIPECDRHSADHCGFDRAEDLATLTTPAGARWVLVAQADPGAPLVFLENETKRRVVAVAADASHCKGEHGTIDAGGLAIDSRGRHVAIINKHPPQRIELLDVKFERDTPRLSWRACVDVPAEYSLNDVALADDGTLYATHMFTRATTPAEAEELRRKFQARLPTGYAIRWHRVAPWQKVPNTDVSFANGIALSDDGRWLAVAGTFDQALKLIDLSGQSAARRIDLPLQPDNVTPDGNDHFLVTGHTGIPVTGVDPCRPSAAKPCGFPFAVAAITAPEGLVEVIHEDDGARTPGASVAIRDGEKLLLGSAFGDRVSVRTPTLAFRHRTVLGAGGVPIETIETGNPRGPPIVFIHGMSQSHLAWLPQLRSTLARDHRLIAFDLRGHGASGKPWRSEDYAESKIWADDIDAVLRALQVERAVFVAWSYGGHALMSYVRHHGIGKIAAIDFTGTLAGLRTVTRPPGADTDRLLAGSRLRASADLEDNIAGYRAMASGLAAKELPAELDEVAFLTGLMQPGYVRRAMKTLPVHNEDLLTTLTMPVWLAMGNRDREWPIEECRALVTALPAARLSVYDGDGHFPSAENPQRFNAELAALVVQAGLTRGGAE